MFEKVKEKIGEIKEDKQRRKEEQARIAKERIEEEARIERERIQVEKNALMALSEKELMVEAILALRGYNTRIENIEEHQAEFDYRVDSLELDVSSLKSNVSDLKAD